MLYAVLSISTDENQSDAKKCILNFLHANYVFHR